MATIITAGTNVTRRWLGAVLMLVAACSTSLAFADNAWIVEAGSPTFGEAAEYASAMRLASQQTAAAPLEVEAQPVSAGSGGTVGGNVFCNGIRLQDEIVLVSTRSIGNCCDPALLRSGLRVENYAICNDAGARRWQQSDFESFLSFDQSVTTIFFVHGNQISPSDAKHDGLTFYRRLMHYGADAPRIRLVIFSWPSSKIGGLLRDVRVKAARTTPAGCQLAYVLDQMAPETPITLYGFSFGARIITGSLHILGGGHLGSCSLSERAHPHRQPVNIVLAAAASHAYWLGEGNYHGLALTQVNRAFFFNNCDDPAMRYYRFVTTNGSPQAMGLRGPTCLNSAQRSQVRQRDVSRSVGSQHNLNAYLCVPGWSAQMWEYIDTAQPLAAAAAN